MRFQNGATGPLGASAEGIKVDRGIGRPHVGYGGALPLDQGCEVAVTESDIRTQGIDGPEFRDAAGLALIGNPEDQPRFGIGYLPRRRVGIQCLQ